MSDNNASESMPASIEECAAPARTRHTSFRARLLMTAMISVLAIAPVRVAYAQAETTTTPAQSPVSNGLPYNGNSQATPTPPDLTSVGQGGCQQEYTHKINSLGDSIADDNIVNVTAEGVALGAEIADATAETEEFIAAGVGLGEAAIGVATPLDAAPAAPGLAEAGVQLGLAGAAEGVLTVALGAEVADFATGLAGAILQKQQQNLTDYSSDLPNCGTEFTGTIQVDANINANQGIAADGGAINLGNPDGTSYQGGITLGGGALSGAGSIGASDGSNLATTGDVTAIAIGNDSQATNAGSVALGYNAISQNDNTVAIGTNANAGLNAAGAIAIG